MPFSVAVQVTFVTASVICLPCMLSGLASLLFVTATAQPSTGCGITDASGWSAGKVTSSLTVEASSRSFGTRKSMTA